MRKNLSISDDENRRLESEKLLQLHREFAKFYEMPSDQDLKEITEELLQSPHVKDAQKKSIKRYRRRIFIFTYPSDGLKIKGVLSFVPKPQNHPLLVFLRGGNRIYGILNPGSDFICFQQYTILATLYRGGVSEGVDEYGGEDVNDVNNLIDYIPELERKLGINIQNKKQFLLGSSRGGMQMFLALAHFPALQRRFSKVVSLCGVLDMHRCIATRPDLKEMFMQEFGLEKGNEGEWINKRDPLLTVQQIKKQLPILIIQGTEDNRVSLEEGHHMVQELQKAGNSVTYLEIDGGQHCLHNDPDRIKLIVKWLES